MRKRTKNECAHVPVATNKEASLNLPPPPAKRDHRFTVTSDQAVPPPPPETRDLGDLLRTDDDSNSDGRVSDRDAVRKVGWRKMDVVLDEQVPICKDYHDTGYCTFGASCKFMHIRDDVLNSSQLERKLALERYKKLQEQQKALEENAEKPEICSICKKFYTDPVITRCGHKFCSKCAMERYRTDQTCQICGKDTHGVFNKT